MEIYKDHFEYVFLTKSDSTLSVIPGSYQSRTLPPDLSIEEEPQWLKQNYDCSRCIVVADGYQFKEQYQKAIKQNGFDLMYVDDLVSYHMYADIVINHSLLVNASDYEAESYTNFALGTRYAILRPLFLEAASIKREVKQIDSVFVCFGGADANNLSLQAVKALLQFNQVKSIHVVLGGAYNHKEIFTLKALHPQLHTHQNLLEPELLSVMQHCNFAIAPASTILYELCAVKMPVLSGYYVDNQKNIYKGCLANACIYDGGNFENCSTEDFVKRIEPILEMKDHSAVMQSQGRLFDSNIKHRFLKLLSVARYRKAQEKDMLVLFNWSNEKLTRANSYSSEPISLENHKTWFAKKLADPNSLLFIAEVDKVPAGLVRYDIGEEHAVVGVIVSENFRGRGLAPLFLKETALSYFDACEKPIHAYIKINNVASVKSFEKAGYQPAGEKMVSGHSSYVFKLEKI